MGKMERTDVEIGLLEVLQNFKRCGLTRFVRSSFELQPALLARLAEPTRELETASALATSSGRRNSQDAPTLPVPSAAMADARSSEATPSASVQSKSAAHGTAFVGRVGGGAWSLPVLDPTERVRQFEGLSSQVRDCRKCGDIVSYRQQTVFGDGNLNPTVCFMGEAPGADEDRTGLPFVGKAGQLLTKIISAMQLSRDEVYILNALKCRPPQNRTPMPDEIESCRPFVEHQLNVLQPKFIVCLGAVAVRSILKTDLAIGRLRGRFHDYHGARVVVTYHPSYLLRNESAKRLVWEDMKMLMQELK